MLQSAYRMWRIGLFLCLLLCCCGVNGQGRTNTGTIREQERALRRIAAAEILKYMNLSADPCGDFYDYACGNWSTYNRVENEHDAVITNQLKLQQQVNADLQKMLRIETAQDTESTRKIKDFYRSCTTAENRSQRQFLQAFVRKHGGLPSVRDSNWHANNNWLQLIALLRTNYGLDILIGLDVDVYLNNVRGPGLCLTEPKATLLPAELCSQLAMQTSNINDEAYNEIEKRICENMQTWFSLNAAEANRFAGDIVRFEFELCKAMRQTHTVQKPSGYEEPVKNEVVQRHGGNGLSSGTRLSRRKPNVDRQDDSPYLYATLDQLTQQFGEIIDFKKFILYALNKTTNDMVYMRSKTYYQQLATTLRGASRPTIANYVMYRALVSFELPDTDRAEFCVNQIMRYFPKHIGEMYARKKYRGEVVTNLDLLTKHILLSFESSLTTDWLDTNDRHAINQKLAQFETKFLNYHNLDLSDLDFGRMNYWGKLEMAMKYSALQKLDPLYSGEYRLSGKSLESTSVDVELAGNHILIGWGLLQKPFYQYWYPRSMKYSFVGQRIARELVSGFGGQQWSDELLVTTPWNEYTQEGYGNRSECLRRQYSNYLYNNPDVFQNASQLQELIADSSGLNVAFNAYLRWLYEAIDRQELLQETLPELNFSNTQLFFINFAQMRCTTKYDEEPPPEFSPLDKHTPERYYVNGPLANSIEFAKEFNCAIGTEMNPDDKCIFY